ncbi:hypothetical protein WJX81_007942 [Elliptochloris bilobata]|uniref:Uncharacterized protein n=1 Tax=Elliptochloris bilobata TaxID=381761 RepID=A0AAW1RN32_9CHLO
MKVHRCIDLNPLQFFRVAPAVSAHSDDSAGAAAAPGACKGMLKVPSLLFDIELEDGSGKADVEEAGVEEVQRRLNFLGRPWSDCEQQLMRQVALAREEAAAVGRPLEADALAERLRCAGHSVTVRTALGGGGGGECLRNLRHTFLNCAVHGITGSVNFLVDPKFREQFEIAHASPRYKAVLAAAPADFVGTEERIVPLVELLRQPASDGAPTTALEAPTGGHEAPKEAPKPIVPPHGGMFAELRRVVGSRAGEVGELSSTGARQMLTGF